MGTPEAFVKSLAAPFDPRTPEGRQNLAATAGATALTAGVTYLTGGVGAGIVPWIARILAGPAGAMVGGMTAEKGEQMAGTKPAIPGEAAYQGTVQGAYELAGQTFLWPIRRLLRGFVAPRVERQARTALESGVTEAVESRTAVTTAARERVRQGVSEAKELARSTVEATREAGRVALRDTKQATAAKLAQLELDNTATLKAVTEQYDNLLAQAAPSIGGAAAATRATLEGPAKRALDAAGQRVAEAAAQGPAITMQPVKDALNEIASKFRPDAIFGQTDEAAAKAIGFQIPEAARASVAAQLGASDSTSKAIAQALGVSADHPLPGLLGKVQNAPETITFADAHKLKMLLDESVNWDRVAKRHLEKITKGLRQVLREQLSAFEPYNVAAAAYQAVIPLYRRGVGKAVTRAATENPDLIARVLDPRKPAQALALRSLLIDQAAAGGDVRIGQEAWDHVRSAMVHDRLLKGGIEGMKDRMTAMLTNYPEFVRVVFNDHTALKVLSNLDHMAEAYTTAVGTGTAKIAATKASGKSAEQIVRDTAAEAIRASRVEGRAGVAGAETAGRAEMDIVRKAASAGVKAARDAQEQLRASSLRGGTVTGQMAEAARALILGPKGSLWGTLSLIRLMHGPQAADLLQYVSHSDKLTQHYVQVLLGQAPDRIVSDVIRDAVGVLSPPTPPAPAAKESPRAPVQPRGTNEPTEPAAVAQ
jgi:hypothetical protein